jgi:MHS family proline/betaine transporter-like MFS transporter
MSDKPPQAKHKVRTVVAGVIGNVLEWYDFALFGFFAPVISHLFFPDENYIASLLQTFGVFAVGYFMRPLGGAIFGHIGDRFGRKRALELSVLLMALPTTLLGLLPTYHQIGMAAPVLLTVIRIVQGISVGGELIGSVSFLGEQAPPGRRGFLGSFSMCSSVCGILLGSAVAAALTAFMPHDALHSWGWRIPFLCGIVVGLVGLYLRSGVQESASFVHAEHGGRSPVLVALAENRGGIVQTFALTIVLAVGFYMSFMWLSTWLRTINTPRLESALMVNTLAMIVLMVLLPSAGALSDRIGRRRTIVLGCLCYVLLSYPAFLILSRGDFLSALCGQLILALCCALTCGPASAAYVEMFPTRTRYSGIAIGYNAAQAVFGGTTPLAATWLISITGDLDAPALYLVSAALVSGAAVLCMRERSGQALDSW